MAKRALIAGITGQDGAYLSRFLLEKGYDVYGGVRRHSSLNTWRMDELGITEEIRMVPIDVLEITNMIRQLERVKPEEIYNLAAQSFVPLSFEQPVYTCDVDALGVVRLLEAIRAVIPEARFYQASSSEMFGKVRESPQTERTAFHPRSPYAVAKVFGHWITGNYREAYGLHATSGILFNHESPLRGLEFVTRKITAAFARIRNGEQDVLELGNLDAKRDWGFAGDYVQGMWMMLQQPEPGDYVLATGKQHSVREFVERAGSTTGYRIAWEGEGENAKGVDRKTGKVLVRINPKFYRPAETGVLVGDASRGRERLGWESCTSFEELVEMMVRADMDRVANGRLRF